MNNGIATLVLATIVISQALAQSHDSSIGSGNIDRPIITAPVGHRQFAANRDRSHPVGIRARPEIRSSAENLPRLLRRSTSSAVQERAA